jgi:predicted RNA-binding protein Jag
MDSPLLAKLEKAAGGGGVGFFYLRSNIKYKLVDELSTFLENVFESMTVEITINHKKNSP